MISQIVKVTVNKGQHRCAVCTKGCQIYTGCLCADSASPGASTRS